MEYTLICATHERARAVRKMIASFRFYYPLLPIIIVDSSEQKDPISDVEYIHVPKNTGIAEQRNIALKQVQTPYFLLVDDDYICTGKTDIHILENNLDIYQVVGGSINNIGEENYDFHGIYEIFDDTLYHFVDIPHIINQRQYYDTIFNFFLAETQPIKEFGGWDKNLKFAREHDDFFLEGKNRQLKVGYNPNCVVDHIHEKKYHGGDNSKSSVEYFCEKRHITNKVEIRLINTGKKKYISYHNCIITSDIIPQYIRDKIVQYFGSYPLIIS